MDAKVVYWSGALLNMLLISGLAVHGVRCAKRGELVRHARAMRGAALLVGLFLISYALKLAFLGREALDTWSPAALWTLRFHELCVLAMVLAGGIALGLGRRLRRSRSFTHVPTDPPAPAGLPGRHRLAGRTALAGAILGVASAAVVLGGMYARAGFVDAPALARAEAPRPAP